MADRQGQSASPSRGGVFTGPSSTSTFNGSTGSGGSAGGVTEAELAIERAARIAGDIANTAETAEETGRATAAEQANTVAIAAEAATRAADDAAETARAIAVEQSLQDQILRRQEELVAGDGISLILDVPNEQADISVDATIARQASLDTEVSTARAAEQANAAEILTKQDTLVAGVNITLVDNGNDTTTVNATQLGDIFELGLILEDPDPRVIEHSDPFAPLITVVYSNLTTLAPAQIFVTAASVTAGSTAIPNNAKVEVNGIEFVRTVDYNIASNIIVFPLTSTSGYTLLQGDNDFIRIYL